MNNEKSSSLHLGKLAIAGVAGYLVWTNRFKIQKFLESSGINTPWMTGDVGEAIGSGVAKAAGKIDYAAKSFDTSKAS